MNWIEAMKSVAVITVSTLIAFFMVEIGYRIYLSSKNPSNESEHTFRVMLFEQGENFKNYADFFAYYPNKKIRSTTLYTTEKPVTLEDVVVEYDYMIETNNLGLVMKDNVSTGQNVVLVAGDSFTEGQGAKPWFYDLERTSSHQFQLLNLGILGTGPMQWENLANHIVEENQLTVNGIVINLILPDINRPVWTFGDIEMGCLRYGECPYRGSFQGFDFSSISDLDDIKISELENWIRPLPAQLEYRNVLLETAKSLARKSKVVMDIYAMLKRQSNSQVHLENFKAILDLETLAKDNLVLNLISSKSINSKNYDTSETYVAFMNFLEHAQIVYSWCDIPKTGFHDNDGHPNSIGYQTVRQCTDDALDIVTRNLHDQ